MEEQSPEQLEMFNLGPRPLSQKEKTKQEKQRQLEEKQRLEEQKRLEKEAELEAQRRLTEEQATPGRTIPLESDTGSESWKLLERVKPPILPSRWEDARDAAIKRNALQVLLRQMSTVEKPLDFLRFLASLATDEGIVWVVYGETGSGKSSFFQTLEYQTNNHIRTHIISADIQGLDLSNHITFASYLKEIITAHQDAYGESTPLVIVLEQRETDMKVEERSAIAQALRNTLRSPGPGKNTIFVLPVTNSTHGDLFLQQARETGVFVPPGHHSIYNFYGPPHTQHVDILSSLCVALNDKDITEYGLDRTDLQKFVSSQQTVGQYIRVIKAETVGRNTQFQKIIRNNSYRPFTVITCFINPLHGNKTEPIIRAMTLDPYGKIRTTELLRDTNGQKAQMWKEKRQALQNIMETLDLRIVEISPEIIAKLLYAYGWQRKTSGGESGEGIVSLVEKRLAKENITYNEPKSVRQNLAQQLRASNLFHIIAGEETVSYSTPPISTKQEEGENSSSRTSDRSEIILTKIACEISHDHQHTLHRMFAQALKDVFSHSTKLSSVANFRDVYSEPSLTLTDNQGIAQKILRPDIVIEMHDKLFLLEFCWRSADHFTYADIAAYVLHKIHNSYLHLPVVKALEAGS